MVKSTDVLFIVKDRLINKKTQHHGLRNAGMFISDYLRSIGIDSQLTIIPDGGYLDATLKSFRPKVVIMEAMWLKPEKFVSIAKENPFVKEIIVRVHSDITYFSIEPKGFQFLFDIQEINDKFPGDTPVFKSALNALNFSDSTKNLFKEDFTYLPNIYDKPFRKSKKELRSNRIDIACYGAIRLLKNHIQQALAAMQAADELGKILYFRINDVDNDAGSTIRASLELLFRKNGKHKLVVDAWRPHGEFLDLIRSSDIGIQLSMTESFNIVAADFISQGTPIIGGESITWLPEELKCSGTDVREIVDTIKRVYKSRNSRDLQENAYNNLNEYNNHAKQAWEDYLKPLLEKS